MNYAGFACGIDLYRFVYLLYINLYLERKFPYNVFKRVRGKGGKRNEDRGNS